MSNHEIADPNVPMTIHVSTDVLNGCPSNQVQGTIFHEVLHTSYLSHDPRHELSDINDGLLWAYTDSVYACERFCFGTLQTRCSCARCLKVRACDAPCSGYASCRVQDANGVDIMSEAVGAVCDRRGPDGGAQGPASGTVPSVAGQWYKTKADCQMSCATGAANCQSFSLSCVAGCE